jgi:hypothetical protein
VCHAAADSNLTVAIATVSPTIFRTLDLLYSSGRKGESDPNLGDPNLLDSNVVDPNILNEILLHYAAVGRSELSKFRTATSGTSNCSVQGLSLAVKVNATAVSRQETTVRILNLTAMSY